MDFITATCTMSWTPSIVLQALCLSDLIPWIFQFALIHGSNIYAILLFTSSDFTSITSHIHSWMLFLPWLRLFILSGAISLPISSSILGTYWPGEFIFQCPIFLPFHTVCGVLKAGNTCSNRQVFGLGVQNEARQRLTEFCQEKTLVIANILFQQHKRMFKLMHNCTHLTLYKVMLKVLQARLQLYVNWKEYIKAVYCHQLL